MLKELGFNWKHVVISTSHGIACVNSRYLYVSSSVGICWSTLVFPHSPNLSRLTTFKFCYKAVVFSDHFRLLSAILITFVVAAALFVWERSLQPLPW